LELTAALFWFWTKRGYLGEARQWLERGLAAESRRSPALRAKALIELAHTAFLQGDYASARVQSEESLSLARKAGDLWAVSWSLLMQAIVAITVGDFERGARLATESQSAALAIGDVRLQGEAVEVLAFSAQERGDHGSADRLYEEALALLRPTGDKWVLGITLIDLATFRVAQGLYAQARVLLAEVIVLNEELANMVGIAWGLEILAAAEVAQGQCVRAAQLWGASDALLDSVGSASFYKLIRDRYVDTAKESLGDTAFQAALAEGRAMSLKHVIQYALAERL
jgi:tetratricopeptide (TPR) repeat protein